MAGIGIANPIRQTFSVKPVASNPRYVAFAPKAGFDFYWNDAFIRNDIALAFIESVVETRQVATGFAEKASHSVAKRMWHKVFLGRGQALVGSRSPLAHLFEHGTGTYGPSGQAFAITAGAIAAERRVGSHRKGTQRREVRRKRGGKKALFWEGATHPVARVVNPGMRAQPFLAPALVAFPQLFVNALRRRFVT